MTARSALLTSFRLSLGPMLALGLARFAYALVLPAMRDALQLSFIEVGWLGTVNAIGYFAGTLATPTLTARFGAKRAFDVSALLTALFTLMIGFSGNVGWLLFARFVNGATGAVTFITGGALVAALAIEAKRPPALLVATYFSGVGLGLVLSGLLMPPTLNIDTGVALHERWRWAWMLCGGIGGLLFLLLRTRWSPATGRGGQAGATQPADWAAFARMSPIMIAYTLFGVGVISYMTFVIAFVQRGLPSYVWVMLTWCLLGASIVIAPRVWRRALDSAPRATAFAAICVTLAVGALLPLASGAVAVVLASAVLFGSFLNIPSSITLYVQRALPREQWVTGLTLGTVAFAIGQGIGPVLVGAIADATQNLAAGLWVAVIALLLAVIVALAQPAVAT